MVIPVTCGGFQEIWAKGQLLKGMEIPLTLLNSEVPGQGFRCYQGVITPVTSPFMKERSWSPWSLEELQGSCPTTKKVLRSIAQLQAGAPSG